MSLNPSCQVDSHPAPDASAFRNGTSLGYFENNPIGLAKGDSGHACTELVWGKSHLDLLPSYSRGIVILEDGERPLSS